MPHDDQVHFEPDRQSFPDRHGWFVSHKGNPYIRLDNGFVITIYEREGGWSGAIYDTATRKTIYAKHRHGSERAAKLAAYDTIMLLIERRAPT